MPTHYNRKKRKHGVGYSEICIIKKVNYATAQRNKNKFDYIADTHPPRFVLNEKILNWIPQYEKGLHKK